MRWKNNRKLDGALKIKCFLFQQISPTCSTTLACSEFRIWARYVRTSGAVVLPYVERCILALSDIIGGNISLHLCRGLTTWIQFSTLADRVAYWSSLHRSLGAKVPQQLRKRFVAVGALDIRFNIAVMYIPPLSNVIQAMPRAMVTGYTPLENTRFTLNSTGVAGLFGGEEAVASIALVHVFEGRKWFGWYNSPGSYIMGIRFSRLARSAVPSLSRDKWEHVQSDLTSLFEYHGQKGPKFRAVHSGTTFQETSHLAALFMKECTELHAIPIEGRETQPVSVTITNLHHVPHHEECPTLHRRRAPFYASVPILVSMGTCVACGWYHDWFSFVVILLGIIVSGISCLVIGSGTFRFTHPEPAPGSPPGDGILGCEDGVVLLKGQEGAVNAVTRGRFSLLFKCTDARRSVKLIRMCSIILVIQAIAQLILVPQSLLFGQFMFVVSVAVSWLYNLWLWSIDKEKVQRDLLMKVFDKPHLTKYILGTRTSMMTFVLLALDLDNPEEVINFLLPANTRAWQIWKAAVIKRLRNHEKLKFDTSDWDDSFLSNQERQMLETLFRDAQHAYEGFQLHKERILPCSKMP
ncbi:hypothetical protein M404DRAFT_298063 [Pisolithus tinctorius Marx 270]|uniref:Uncharacterized protein n=1 Tax=Pisolithus tinctorius Marx 270 TaxID=870435 RepID=A0A0C3NK47_PISTI|nr:hypothetical protein M404DRAFT_298063 [Pisolithus tinctorius Marx 270]